MLIERNTSGFAKWIYCGNDDLKKDEEVIASILSNLIRHILKYRKNDNWKKYKKHRQNSGMLPMDLLANLAVAAILDKNNKIIENRIIASSFKKEEEMVNHFLNDLKTAPDEASLLICILDNDEKQGIEREKNEKRWTNETEIIALLPKKINKDKKNQIISCFNLFHTMKEKIIQESITKSLVNKKIFFDLQSLNIIKLITELENKLFQMTGHILCIFKGNFDAKEEKAVADSERLILNFIDYIIKHHKEFKECKKIILFTERIPCSSCNYIILNFCKEYPNIDLIIAFNSIKDIKEFNCLNNKKLKNLSYVHIRDELLDSLHLPEFSIIKS